MKYYIFGNSGFADELLLLANDCDINVEAFVCLEKKQTSKILQIEEKDFFPNEEFFALIGAGSPFLREKIVKNLKNTFNDKVIFPSLIHPTSRIMGLKNKTLSIGEGTIICANSTITSNVQIGKFGLLNYNCTIGHDVEIGNFFTASPGVNISGWCKIMNNVQFGANSCTKEKLYVESNTIIGCGASVISNIYEQGTYVGVPAIRKK